MKPTKNIYPVFEANQVLTNEHLNQGFEYLDEQERLTRANLTGIGIVCGLEISFDGTNVIISKGCGITSEGYLVVLVLPAGLTLGFYKDYHLPKDLEYQPFLNPAADKAQFNLWEITAEANDTTTPLNKDKTFLKDKVVLLFVELIKEDLKDCTPNNCNDKGAKVTATIRPLLIDKNNLLPYKPGLDVTSGELPDLIRLLRPKNFTTKGIVITYKDILDEIWRDNKLLNIDFNNVWTNYNKRYKEYISDPFISLKTLLPIPQANSNFVQYYYDFFLDVIQAYNELICFTDKNPVCACVPDPVVNNFPRHLMLGLITDKAAGFRHVFTPSKALIDQRDETQTEEKRLYMRLVEITKQFKPADLHSLNDIKITPTQYGDFPLAQKAIPFYYKPFETSTKPSFADLWTTGKRCSGLAVETNSYHSTNNPLNYHLEAYNFFRIEGHIGQSMAEASKDIQDKITTENLPFSVLPLDSTAFNEFALKNPGLTHGAGVPTGGTFIMVSDGGDGGKVIADFFLPYRVFEVSELSEVCEVCKQKEIPKICLIIGSILIILLMYLMGNKHQTERQSSLLQGSTKAEKECVTDLQHLNKSQCEKI